MKKKTNIASYIAIAMLVLFALVFLVIGIAGKVNLDTFMGKAEKTEARITRIEEYYTRNSKGKRVKKHDVYVQYTVDGKTYNSELDSYNSSMYESKIIEVYYDPDRPGKIMSGDNLPFIIMMCVGGVFAVIAVVVLVKVIKSNINRKNLITNGTIYTGTIITVREITNVKVNGRHPFKADCEVINPLTQERFLFSSDYVYSDIRHIVGVAVVVYMYNNNPSNHYVDAISAPSIFLKCPCYCL